MHKQSLKLCLSLYFTIILWASAFVGIRIAVKNYTPGALALFRYMVASVVICPIFLKYRSKGYRLRLKEILTLLLVGVLGFGVYNVAINYGEITTSAAVSSFIPAMIAVTYDPAVTLREE